ncbi:hypothetical protein CDAR_105211 [Caerostris darwini]|uniref:Uncharacterized protein n=1 Tax=Caerostris darwini TaxID=1538125 RepID=A0AAV4V5R0_9ARAC|nr:hypothetical protein CDAR_105211 [Caerostris darwini]
MDKSPPNQVQPQLSGPSTSSSTPQENLTAQILQSLVKELYLGTKRGKKEQPQNEIFQHTIFLTLEQQQHNYTDRQGGS